MRKQMSPTVSRTARPPGTEQDSERLLDELRAFALRMLSQYGEFVPFGAYVDSHGIIKRLDANGAGSSSTASRLEQVREALARVATDRKPRAIGYAANVSVPGTNGGMEDAVHVLVESRGGPGKEVCFVYTLQQGHVTIVRTLSTE